MDFKERVELVKRNTLEVIQEDELAAAMREKKKPITYCGYEPSGEVHLGHMVTVTKLMDLEKAGFKVKVLFADWHAWLNKKGSWDSINETTQLWEKVFKGLGLKYPEFILGTEFQRTTQYVNDVMKLSLNTTLNRAMRSMQEIARDAEHATVSQMIYPLMQIADIKHLHVDVAQAGIEQRKIHMLGRELMHDIDYKKPCLVHTPLVESLQGPGKKMSSSIPESVLSARDSPQVIEKKIGKTFCPEGQTEGNPVLQITKLVVFPRIEVLEVKRDEKFGGNANFESYDALEKAFAKKELHPMDLKKAVSEQLIELLEPVRKVFEKHS